MVNQLYILAGIMRIQTYYILPTMLLVVADSQQSFDTEIGQVNVSDSFG